MEQNISGFPGKIEDESHLEELLSRPEKELVDMFSRLEGDIIILGITGKIGPSLAVMAARASKKAGVKRRILGISRSINAELQKRFDESGIETVRGDLLDPEFVQRLPAFMNVFYLAGMKFGAVSNLPLTWAINSYLPALIAGHFKNSRIVAFSTGCVYPLVTIESGGSVETDQPQAIGEYAQSCLGRERMFEYGSNKFGTKTTIIRLNYSVELRYGVVVDIAKMVMNKIPVSLSMSHFNAIWQGDMNNFVLQSIEHSASPARIINITGPEMISVKEVAMEFGKLFGVEPVFKDIESPTSLLSNAGLACSLFGKPKVSVNQIIKWTAGWMKDGGKLFDKPTYFEVRDGNY